MNTLYRLISWCDTRTIQWYASRKYSREIGRVFRWVSRTGNGDLYLMLGIALWMFEPSHGAEFFATGLIAYGIELVVYFVIKNTFRRNRPFDHIKEITPSLLPSDKFSFPSGHTAAAFVMASLITWFYPQFATLSFCCAALIGVSRVMLCVHYPSDILAGALLGVASTWGALHLMGF